jgi:methylmalonyl-CoA mutase cobalamin-binding subunit
MSKQQGIVPEVIQLITECGVPVGLILGGSVAQSEEWAGSDVDFFFQPRQNVFRAVRRFSSKMAKALRNFDHFGAN